MDKFIPSYKNKYTSESDQMGKRVCRNSSSCSFLPNYKNKYEIDCNDSKNGKMDSRSGKRDGFVLVEKR